MTKVNIGIHIDYGRFSDNAQRLCDALDDLLQFREPGCNGYKKIGALLLKLHLTQFRLIMEKNSNPGKKREDSRYWDQKVSDFDAMLHDAAEVVRLRSSGNSAPAFSLDLGITSPLYYTVRRCREPSLRRKAIDLLRAADCQEGIWNSRLVAKVVDTLVNIEESGISGLESGHQIPLRYRVTHLKVDVLPAESRSAMINYKRDGNWSQYELTWD